MSAFGRERVRTLLLTGLSAAAAACATSVAFADPQSPLGPSATDVGAEMRLSSPLVGEGVALSYATKGAPW